MSKKFTRNVKGIEDITKFPLTFSDENDLLQTIDGETYIVVIEDGVKTVNLVNNPIDPVNLVVTEFDGNISVVTLYNINAADLNRYTIESNATTLRGNIIEGELNSEMNEDNNTIYRFSYELGVEEIEEINVIFKDNKLGQTLEVVRYIRKKSQKIIAFSENLIVGQSKDIGNLKNYSQLQLIVRFDNQDRSFFIPVRNGVLFGTSALSHTVLKGTDNVTYYELLYQFSGGNLSVTESTVTDKVGFTDNYENSYIKDIIGWY